MRVKNQQLCTIFAQNTLLGENIGKLVRGNTGISHLYMAVPAGYGAPKA